MGMRFKKVEGLPYIYIGWYLHGFTWGIFQYGKVMETDPSFRPVVHSDEEEARVAARPALRQMLREILEKEYGAELLQELAEEVLEHVTKQQ